MTKQKVTVETTQVYTFTVDEIKEMLVERLKIDTPYVNIGLSFPYEVDDDNWHEVTGASITVYKKEVA